MAVTAGRRSTVKKTNSIDSGRTPSLKSAKVTRAEKKLTEANISHLELTQAK